MLAINPEKIDEYFMNEALREAKKAKKSSDVPVGAVVVLDQRIIGRGYNQVEMLNDPTAHAEMIAVTSACATINEKFLRECTLYVTVEPCSMCAGAAVLARIKRIVYGVQDIKTGAHSSLFNLLNEPRLNHRIEVKTGVLRDQCAHLMVQFFEELRNKES